MGISIELYRIRIGHFESNKPGKMKCKKLRSGKYSNITILIFSILIFQLDNGCFQTPSDFSRTANLIRPKYREIGWEEIKLYSWAQSGLSINKFQKIINGNRRSVGYKLAVWNCGRGLVQEGFSVKFHEIKQFLETKGPHCFGIIESDLHGHQSQTNRVKYSTAELRELLKVDGYNIEFPRTWDTHGQARIICYVSQEIKYSCRVLNNNFDLLPTITLEIGLGKATRTTVHYYYREWKNGVTGESSSNSQLNHIKQHISQWKEIADSNRNFVALGDANLCALSWNEQHFRYKELSEEVLNFLLEESCFQLVNKPTRVQSVAGNIQKSCLDHVTTNIPEKCSIPEVFNEGSSDHLPVMVTKFSREPRTQPKKDKKEKLQKLFNREFLK